MLVCWVAPFDQNWSHNLQKGHAEQLGQKSANGMRTAIWVGVLLVMCRQGGYFDQAAYLARRHDEHGLVVDILVEDLKKYEEAMAYIVRLVPKDAYANFMKYAVVLLTHRN